MKKIILKGYYGQNNLGDDYILYSILDTLNTNGKYDLSIVVGDAGDSSIFMRFKNLKFHMIPQKKWRRFNKLLALLKANYWIIGGGGLWPAENVSALNTLWREIRLSRLLHTRVCFYGIDINSITLSETKNIWRKISRKADFIICRNRRTTKMLKELGCRNIFRSSDLTFGLLTDAEKNDNKNCLKKIGVKEYEYVIWSILMPWPSWEFEIDKHGERYRLLVQQLREIANMEQFKGITHVFMPFHYQMEMSMIYDIVNGIKNKTVICDSEKRIDIGEKRLLFKYAKQCISMKFHGAMFSIYNGTPAAMISYSDKTSDVLKEIGLEDYFVEYGIRETQDFYKCFDLDIEKFRVVVERSCRPEARTDFERASKMLRNMSGKCKERLLKWLKNGF